MVGAAVPLPLALTYGDARDHRPALKQFVMTLVCWGEGAIPACLELAAGKQSAQTRVASLRPEFQSQWDFEGLDVADAALDSEVPLPPFVSLRWRTRVPLTLKIAAAWVSHLPAAACVDSPLQGARLATVCCADGGVQQRWFVVESPARKQSQAFACEADAFAALKQFEPKLVWQALEPVRIKQKRHDEKPGQPQQDTAPSRLT